MRHSKSSLFLMELIISILFFSLASTVCIRLFAKSHLLSQEAVDQNQAVAQAQNLAECYLAMEGDLGQIAALFPDSVLTEDGAELTLYYDSEWATCTVSDAYEYAANLQHQPADERGLITGEVEVLHRIIGTVDDATIATMSMAELADSSSPPGLTWDTIYSLRVKHHIPERRGSHE